MKTLGAGGCAETVSGLSFPPALDVLTLIPNSFAVRAASFRQLRQRLNPPLPNDEAGCCSCVPTSISASRPDSMIHTCHTDD